MKLQDQSTNWSLNFNSLSGCFHILSNIPIIISSSSLSFGLLQIVNWFQMFGLRSKSYAKTGRCLEPAGFKWHPNTDTGISPGKKLLPITANRANI